MDRHKQSALIRQASVLATLSLETPATANMQATKRDLTGYTASLTLVKDAELAPFGKQAIALVKATLKYLHKRTEFTQKNAHAERDKLTQMMADAEKGGK